jgi:hypothetical protein
MAGGDLLYKCRLCGKIFSDVHVPDKDLGLLFAMKSRVHPDWGTTRLEPIVTHWCGYKRTGVADLIGVDPDAQEEE